MRELPSTCEIFIALSTCIFIIYAPPALLSTTLIFSTLPVLPFPAQVSLRGHHGIAEVTQSYAVNVFSPLITHYSDTSSDQTWSRLSVLIPSTYQNVGRFKLNSCAANILFIIDQQLQVFSTMVYILLLGLGDATEGVAVAGRS